MEELKMLKGLEMLEELEILEGFNGSPRYLESLIFLRSLTIRHISLRK
jgi:hypothetical protein